jgi:hypothetical protein
MVVQSRLALGLKLIVMLLSTVVLLYLASFFFIFNPFTDASQYDSETDISTGKMVTLGPRPYHYICGPKYENLYYDGKEWPFKAFRPFCWVFATCRGEALYGPP